MVYISVARGIDRNRPGVWRYTRRPGRQGNSQDRDDPARDRCIGQAPGERSRVLGSWSLGSARCVSLHERRA